MSALVRRIAPAVIEILGANPGPMTLEGTCTYLVGSGADRLLVDAGEGRPEWKAALTGVLEEEGCGITACLLTHHHYDHVGGVVSAMDVAGSGMRVLKAPHSERHVRWPVMPDGSPLPVEALTDGDTFEVEGAKVRVLATPGHTSDSVTFLADGDGVVPGGRGRAAFVGDCVMGRGNGVVSDLQALEASLRALEAAAPTALYCGHGSAIGGADSPGAAVEALRRLRSHRRERADQVLSALRAGGGGTAASLAADVYAAAGMAHVMEDPTLSRAAAFQTLIALRYWMARGACTVEGAFAGEADTAPAEGAPNAADVHDATVASWKPAP